MSSNIFLHLCFYDYKVSQEDAAWTIFYTGYMVNANFAYIE